MSFLYRPTPVVRLVPQSPLLSGAVSGGVMHGYDNGVNWKAYFDSQRAATQGSPWIVRSGTMGGFLGQDDGSDGSLPLPTDIGGPLSPLPSPLPVDLYPLSPPVDPSIVPFTPGTPPIVTAPGGGGSIPAVTNWTQLLNSLSSLGTNIAKAATGQAINPTIPPVAPVASTLTTPSSLVAQAQALQAQAAALQASNPTLAAQYQQQANSLMAQAAQAGAASGANWFTQATIIPGMPNWILPAGAGVFIVLLSIGLKSAGRR